MQTIDAPKLPNGLYTITNTETGQYRTFRVKTIRKGNLADRRVLGILTGPDNESDYLFFAFVEHDHIKLWKKFSEKPHFRFYAQIFGNMAKGLEPRTGYSFSLSKRCLVCNRTLTTPESLARGIGPECAAR